MAPQKRATRSPSKAAIRAARERRGLTQEQAAEKIGVSRRQWNRYEAGEKCSGPIAILLRLFIEEKI